jgi:hypothetical protein
MAVTYIKIASVTVGSGGASSIDFTSIPGTYTDLCLKVSARNNRTDASYGYLYLTLNASTSNFTGRFLYGNASSGASYSGTNNEINESQNTDYQTANTFGNTEIYIPNYASANYKSISADGVNENNSAAADSAISYLTASLWSNTAAITSISLTTQATKSFKQYSTATLYGISKS